jgi:hypothetical protein
MITKLHELPPDHHLRNTAIQHIDVRIKCRHSGTTRDPRTWRIRNDTYNRLSDTWQNNFDFIIQPAP